MICRPYGDAVLLLKAFHTIHLHRKRVLGLELMNLADDEMETEPFVWRVLMPYPQLI